MIISANQQTYVPSLTPATGLSSARKGAPRKKGGVNSLTICIFSPKLERISLSLCLFILRVQLIEDLNNSSLEEWVELRKLQEKSVILSLLLIHEELQKMK